MSFLTSLFLVVFVIVGPCLSQEHDPIVLLRLTLEDVVQKQDMILQRFDEQETKLDSQQTMMQDGCEKNTNNCSIYATCSCMAGYSGDGVICEDIDECSVENNCHKYASCTNTEGSKTCQCLAGYDGDGYTCTDIDECSAESNCDKHASCTNTQGSFNCQCLADYEGNGYTCGFICTSPNLELEPFGCIKYVKENMIWSDAQAKCNADGGSLLYGFTTKQQLITIVQHVHQHFDVELHEWQDWPWVGVRGGLFVKSPSDDDGPPGGTSSSSPHTHLWAGLKEEPTGTLGDDTQYGYVDLDPSNPKLWDTDFSSIGRSSLCQILY